MKQTHKNPYDAMMEAMEKAGRGGHAPRAANGALEHGIQVRCVTWFRARYPQHSKVLFAVPNGGFRNKATAGKMKAEGVVAGVADLILLVPNSSCHGLCIEMKWEKVEYDGEGRRHVLRSYQREEQKDWQAAVEAHGYRYVVCRSFDDFRSEVERYIEEA